MPAVWEWIEGGGGISSIRESCRQFIGSSSLHPFLGMPDRTAVTELCLANFISVGKLDVDICKKKEDCLNCVSATAL